MKQDAKIPVIARAQWLCYSSEIGTVLKNDNILYIKMISVQMIWQKFPYLPHTDNGVSNENEKNDKGFDEGCDLRTFVFMFFK